MAKKTKIVYTFMMLSSLSFAEFNVGVALETIIDKAIREAPSNFYVGLGISTMKLNNTKTNENLRTISIMLQGGYKIYNFLAIEGRYTRNMSKVTYDAGSTNSSNIDDYPTDFTNIAIYLKPSYLYYDFSTYALLGYGVTSLTNLPIGDVTRAEKGFQWGIGLSYEITKNISFFADYVNCYNSKGFDYRSLDEDITVDTISIGINYKF